MVYFRNIVTAQKVSDKALPSLIMPGEWLHLLRCYRFFLFIVLFIVLLFAFPCFNHVYSAEKNSDTDFEFQAPQILDFTRHLISLKEYYRAHIELNRLNLYYPGFLSEDNSFVTELYLFYKGGRYSGILGREYTGTGPVSAIDMIFKTDVFLNRMDFVRADSLVRAHAYNGDDRLIEFYIYKRLFVTHLLLKNIDRARELIDASPVAGIAFQEYRSAMEYSVESFDSFKNPWNSMMFGVIPGAGYIHAGNKSTGIVAMAVVSVFSALTYLAFRTDNKSMGVMFGAAATFFYGGSIVGGYLESGKHNVKVMSGVKDYLFECMNIDDDREQIYKKYGIER